MRQFYRRIRAIALGCTALLALLSSHAQAAIPSASQAPIAMLVDLTSGQVLHEREVDRRFIPASITKVMTAYVAFELIADGKLSPQQTFVIRPETHAEWFRKGSTMFLPAGEPATVDNLLRGITTISANDGAIVLAESAAGSVDQWTAMMNEKAREIGMRNSHFGTPNGWPDEGQTFVTARDLVTLADALISKHSVKYGEYFGHTGFRYGGVAQANHDPLVGRVDGADGIKTGFTNEAGNGYLGSVEREGRRLVLVIAGSPSEPIRAEAARSYVEWGFSNFTSQQIFRANDTVGRARVQNGSASSVTLAALKPVRIAVPAGTEPKISMSIRYFGPLKAPIAAGQEVAQLEVRVDGMPTSNLPLIAAEDVGEASFFGRIANGFGGWFG